MCCVRFYFGHYNNNSTNYGNVFFWGVFSSPFSGTVLRCKSCRVLYVFDIESKDKCTEKVEMVAQTLRNCGGQPNPAPPSTDCSFQKCSRPKWQRGLKKKFPAHFLWEKMNARKKKKGMGAPKGILGQRRRPYPQIFVTPTFCIFTGIDDFIHYSPHINQQKL